MAITNKTEWLHFNFYKDIDVLMLNSYQYNFIFIYLLVLKIGIKLEKKYFSPKGGCFIMAMSTGACWGGHFCVEPGIFVSNRAFLCRTMHFAVEPGFFVSNECYNTYPPSMSIRTTSLFVLSYNIFWYTSPGIINLLDHLQLDRMAAISQTIVSDEPDRIPKLWICGECRLSVNKFPTELIACLC